MSDYRVRVTICSEYIVDVWADDKYSATSNAVDTVAKEAYDGHLRKAEAIYEKTQILKG